MKETNTHSSAFLKKIILRLSERGLHPASDNNKKTGKFYSCEEEEYHIIRHFKGFTGIFLDIGAYDGKTGSNTYRLAELGWQGVCVEPSPSCFRFLKLTHKDNSPKIRLLNSCIGAENKKVDFYDNMTGLATAVKSFAVSMGMPDDLSAAPPARDPFRQWEKTTVQMIRVESLLKIFPEFRTYEFVSIDAEGMDMHILEQLPINGIKVKMICIECMDNDRFFALDFLTKLGFRVIYENQANLLAARG